ncbi:hypothetical protein [Oceanihabitans sediminis]|uniref:hypothetical protein n=1 Tax=Oceanihabitans sediminis TaxID=1812012 RepID=UPI000F500366|nr:hypothetical protein [Oceanihabitans sediminis]
MRIQIIILILITNFAFGQDKVTIDKNLPKYEIKDEFNRFDDIGNPKNDFESLKFNFKSNSEIEIRNSYTSGFTGNDIKFSIDKHLNIKKVTYNYWTDVVDLDNLITYRVKKVNLKLNQNPFDKINGLRGMYILEVQHIRNDSLIKTEQIKGKFKNFKGINKQSSDYKWTLEQNKIWYGITNENGVYLKPDKVPSLKSDYKILVKEIKNIKGYVPSKIKAFVVINENGKIEEKPIRFLGQLDKSIEKQITKLLIELTEWYPACVNEKEVKSQIPIVIGTE